MELVVYILLIVMLLIVWVWSHFVQTSTESVHVTERVGSTLTWLILIESFIGLVVIILGNILNVNTWKVFMMLIIVMVEILVMFWVTYQYVGVVVSHKVPEEDRKKESYTMVVISALVSFSLVVSIILKGDLAGAVMLYLALPIVLIGERFGTILVRKKEYRGYPRISEEDVREAERALEEKIDKGLTFGVRENFLKRKVSKQRQKTKDIMDYTKKETKEEELEEGGEEK